MEFANEDIFNIRFNEGKDCLETKQRTSFIKEHKIMSAIISTTIVLIGLNVFLIYEFFNILNTL